MAHFEPDEIWLFGEGVFPRVSLDLPRGLHEDMADPQDRPRGVHGEAADPGEVTAGAEDPGAGHYAALLSRARENVAQERREMERPSSAVSATAAPDSPQNDAQVQVSLSGCAEEVTSGFRQTLQIGA